MKNTQTKKTMKEQELIGKKCNLLFYYPLGKKKMRAQIYDKSNDDVVVEWKVTSQEQYDEIFNYFISQKNYTETL
jgi:hypothetical protein